MPNLWANVDLNFPTFVKGEKTEVSLQKLQSYMFTLTEALKYGLENLDSQNWNQTALQETKADTTAGVEAEAAAMAEELAAAQEALTALRAELTELQAELTTAKRTAQEARSLAYDALEVLDYISIDSEQQSVELHGERVDINGNVYINGVLQE